MKCICHSSEIKSNSECCLKKYDLEAIKVQFFEETVRFTVIFIKNNAKYILVFNNKKVFLGHCTSTSDYVNIGYYTNPMFCLNEVVDYKLDWTRAAKIFESAISHLNRIKALESFK